MEKIHALELTSRKEKVMEPLPPKAELFTVRPPPNFPALDMYVRLLC